MLWQPQTGHYDPSAAVLGAVGLGVSLYLMCRSWFEGVELRADQWIVRRTARTYRFPIDQVRQVTVGHGGVMFPIWRTLTLETSDGKRIDVGAVRSLALKGHTRVDRIAEELNRFIQERAQSDTGPPCGG
jgi:hypothetical protein